MPSSTMGSTSVWFLHRGADQENIQQGISLLHGESDRSAAIIGGTIVELTLNAALVACMHREEKLTSELMRTTGPFGAFGTKIDLGYLIGIYGKEAHRDLVTMKDIRNAFAHKLEVKDFRSQKISALARNLTLVEKHTEQAVGYDAMSESPAASHVWIGIQNRERTLADPRERYLLSAQVLCAGLSNCLTTRMPTPLF